jgi:cell division protein FtsB
LQYKADRDRLRAEVERLTAHSGDTYRQEAIALRARLELARRGIES